MLLRRGRRHQTWFCLLLLLSQTIPPAERVLDDATVCPGPLRNPHVVDERYPELARSSHPLVSPCLLGPFLLAQPHKKESLVLCQPFRSLGRLAGHRNAKKLIWLQDLAGTAAAAVSACSSRVAADASACCPYPDTFSDDL